MAKATIMTAGREPIQSTPFSIQLRRSEREINCPVQKPSTRTLSTNTEMRTRLFPLNFQAARMPNNITAMTTTVFVQPNNGALPIAELPVSNAEKVACTLPIIARDE